MFCLPKDGKEIGRDAGGTRDSHKGPQFSSNKRKPTRLRNASATGEARRQNASCASVAAQPSRTTLARPDAWERK